MVLEDCCSSQTPENQRANMEDMRRAGAFLTDTKVFFLDFCGFSSIIKTDVAKQMF